jgi:uridine monophosphate synthetase
VEESQPYAAAFKPNSAFFEFFGPEGFFALQTLMKAIPSDIPIILDCKRGDIDTTAAAYASAAYEIFGADCVTLSPYMGWDSVKPFVTGQYSHKGAFILCKTSNSSSSEMQSLQLDQGVSVFEKVVELVQNWGSGLGLVAGATNLSSLQRIRSLAPNHWILCPGVGAQGGEPEAVCAAGLRADGSGLLVSVSRSISKADDIASAAKQLRDEINVLRHLRSPQAPEPTQSASSSALQTYQRNFLAFALQEQALQFGSFTLKSGRKSPYFFNAGRFCTGHSLSMLGSCYAQAVHEAGLQFEVVFGPAYKGIPLVTAFATAWFQLYKESKDIAYNRKEAKDHGEGGMLVGAQMAGRKVLIIDDVITAGTAIREAVDMLRAAKGDIVATVVCLDRQERASEQSALSAIQQVTEEFGFPVLSIVKLQHLVAYALELDGGSSSGSQGRLVNLQEIEAYRRHYGTADD